MKQKSNRRKIYIPIDVIGMGGFDNCYNLYLSVLIIWMKKLLPFLAVACSGFLVYLFDKIWGNSINWAKIKTLKIGDLLNSEVDIKLYHIILFLVLAALIYFIAKKRMAEKPFYSTKQQKLREYNEETDTESEILFRWAVYFDYNTPFIADLESYCTKHPGVPIRFVGGRCPYYDCPNSRNRINDHLVKNHIESVLIDRWRKMK